MVPKPTNAHKYMKYMKYTHVSATHVAVTCRSCAVCVINVHTFRCAFFGFDVMSKAL